MNFYDRITGNDMTRAYKQFDARAKILPKDYQVAWEKIKASLWNYSDITGRNLTPILDGVLGLLEESAEEDISIDEVLGDDIEGFCAAVAGAEGAKTYRDKWREQLNHNVAKKLGK